MKLSFSSESASSSRMEESSRTDYIVPTTEHGMPIDPAEAATQVNFKSFEQPVYRSICVEAPPEIPDPMRRYFSDPVVQVRDDLALEKMRYTKSRSNTIELSTGNSGASKPLNLSDYLVLERTKFTTTGEYSGVRARLVGFLQTQNVAFLDDNESPTLHCSFYIDGSLVSFDVNIYHGDSSFVIEFQRHAGCPILFNKLFRKSQSWFNSENPAKERISAQQLTEMLQLNRDESSQRLGLQTLRRWMREDPDEASGAFASLVSSGFLTGPDVVEFAMEVTETSLLHALCSLSKLACTDPLSVASFWDRLKQRLISALIEGDAHMVAEACELCGHMQTHARNHSDLCHRTFVDHDVISAATSRLARDSSKSPFCVTVAVRTMMQAVDSQVNA